MKKRIPSKQIIGKNARKRREGRTGEHCPFDGWWVPAGQESDARFIAEGSIMPPSNGEPVTWRLGPATLQLREPKHAHPAAGAAIDVL